MFQRKLILSYLFLIILLFMLFICIVFIIYDENYRTNENLVLKQYGDTLSRNFNDNVKTMSSAFDFILSDIDLLNGLRVMSSVGQNKTNRYEYVYSANSEINDTLSTYYISNSFYRVVISNEYNNYWSSNRTLRPMDTDLETKNVLWYSDLKDTGGTSFLFPPYKDYWGKDENPQVYSLVKEIQGDNLGYIEVQNLASDLENILLLDDKTIDIILVNSTGNLIYTTNEYSKDIFQGLQSGEVKEIRYNGELTSIYKKYSDITETCLYLVKTSHSYIDLLRIILPIGLLIGVIILIFSFIYIKVISNKFIKPLRQIGNQFKVTELENLNADIKLSTDNDEILILTETYKNMIDRIKEGIENEKNMYDLKLQAQFDSLQAQVNPHFLYNVLNVIAYRGALIDDETICEMCDTLSEMLRYSTNIKEKYSTIEMEIENINDYFYLLSKRYEHKLSYKIDIDKSIFTETVPKLFLQQLVENSIQHGFSNANGEIKIEVIGKDYNKYWEISVKDSGIGFNKEKILELNTKMIEMKKIIESGNENIELEIGGMGLVNIYTRFYLMVKDNLKIDFQSENGTEIKFKVFKR
ncbi:MAG: sensor histidine kinase [Lachnospirales bacterium]